MVVLLWECLDKWDQQTGLTEFDDLTFSVLTNRLRWLYIQQTSPNLPVHTPLQYHVSLFCCVVSQRTLVFHL